MLRFADEPERFPNCHKRIVIDSSAFLADHYPGPANARHCSQTRNHDSGPRPIKAFTYSEARQNLASLLDLARTEVVEIRRKDGSRFILRAQSADASSSPLDVPGVKTSASTSDILDALREVRERG
jgi:hypothetical protein